MDLAAGSVHQQPPVRQHLLQHLWRHLRVVGFRVEGEPSTIVPRRSGGKTYRQRCDNPRIIARVPLLKQRNNGKSRVLHVLFMESLIGAWHRAPRNRRRGAVRSRLATAILCRASNM